MRHFLVVSFSALALTSLANAQLSYARSAFERLRSAMSEVSTDREDSRLDAAARTALEQANAMSAALSELGRSIAGSGPFESDRVLVANLAQQLRRTLELTARNAQGVSNTVQGRSRFSTEADYRKELANQVSDLKLGYENTAREWDNLQRRIEETRRWLKDRLSEAQAMRDNTAKPAEALQRAEEQMQAQRDSLNERFRSAFFAWVSAKERSSEANVRENESFRQWQNAIQAADGNQFAERVKDLANRWLEAKEAQMAAERSDWEAFVALERASEERKRGTAELARAMTEVRNFAREATSDAINRRWAELDRWSREYEREMSR
jgi:hypothetical protein